MAAPVITHRKISGKAAGTDSTRVYGTHWDDTHAVTGLENVDNTSDANKPVSTAQAAADAVVAANAANAANLTSGTVAAARMPALTGDVTMTAGTTATTLAAGNAGNLNSGTLLAARMPALTGDITTSTGAVATTLATVNSNVGSFGSATQAAVITVNGKGLVTAAANATITTAVGSITGLGTGVATFLATPSSANLASALTDETGTGAAVFANSPALITPTAAIDYGGSAAGSTKTINGTSNGSPSSAFLSLQTNGQRVGINNASPLAPLHVGNLTSNSASVSTDTALLVDRAVDDTGIGGHAHGVSDSSTMDRSGVFGYSSFDARVQYTGTKSYDHHIGYQSYQLLGTTGTISERYGFFDGSSLTAGTVTKWAGFRATAPSVTGTGSIGTIHGLLVDDISAASATAYAVKTEGTTKSSFGGNVGVGTTSPSSVSSGGAGRVAEIAGVASYATLSLSSSGASASSLGGIVEVKSTASLSGGDSRLGNLFWLRSADVTAGKLTAQFSLQTAVDGTLVLSAQSGAGGSLAIKGTTTNDSASAGQVGEYVSGSLASGSALALVANTETTIASMSLTAGDWDVEGRAAFSGTGRTYIAAGPNTTTNTLPTADNYSAFNPQAAATVVADNVVFPRQRFSLSATTTVYLVVKAGFSTSCSAYGSMSARRVR